MLTRVHGARDWQSGIDLKKKALGGHSDLHLHHIFPKARLYDAGYDRTEVNALANFTFLTAETNIRVSDADPAAYLPDFQERNPGVLASHWIPLDERLWTVERYPEFLEARRVLLARAANEFLQELSGGRVSDHEMGDEPLLAETPSAVMTPGSVASDDELALLLEVNEWVVAQGLPEGELLYELVEEDTGTPLAHLDLAWPDGLQPGLSRPVAVLIDEAGGAEEAANQAGYRFFTDATRFREYVDREILAGR